MMRSILAAFVAVGGLMAAQLCTSSPVEPVGDREALSVVGGQAATNCTTWVSTTQVCGSAFCSVTMTSTACPNIPFWVPGAGSKGVPKLLKSTCAVCGGLGVCNSFICIRAISACCD
jgi:hypothetical protein